MAEGHLLQKSGKKDKLWSSIQAYNKAAMIFEKAGAPYYYIGNSYLKLGDKDFDLIIFPNKRHGFGDQNNYFTRRKWDYFVKHLLDLNPPANFSLD